MTVTIDLSAEIEAGLSALAEAQGMALPDYLKRVLEEQSNRISSSKLSPRERAAIWSDVSDLPLRPPLSDAAIDRSTMYGQQEL